MDVRLSRFKWAIHQIIMSLTFTALNNVCLTNKRALSSVGICGCVPAGTVKNPQNRHISRMLWPAFDAIVRRWRGLCTIILLLTPAFTGLIGCESVKEAKNVLALFPHRGYSHFKVFYPVMRELAHRGHNVTVVTYIKSNDRTLPNYQELLLHGAETVNVFNFDDFIATRTLRTLLREYFILHQEGQESCAVFYESPHVATILQQHQAQPYDLIISEYFNTDCYLGMARALNVPLVVGFSSCVLMPFFYDRIALPDTPSYVQSEFVGFPETLDWQQRLLNFVQMKLVKFLYRFHTNAYDNRLIAKYLNITMDVTDFAKRSTAVILVNQHYSLGGTRPQMPQVIDIGGVHLPQWKLDADADVATNQTLPHEITVFLNKAKHGVIFISWGSMLRGSSLPPKKLQAVLTVLQQQPMSVIWKWEGEPPPSVANGDKILFIKWAPQLALLCHPKVRVFWGHGGLLGTTEAAFCGKPMLLTPIYGDQFLNANKVRSRNAGLIMQHNDLEDQQQLTDKLQQLAQESYWTNAQTLRRMFRQRQQLPLDTAVWWIEHLMAHDGNATPAYLRNEAVHLNWFVYHSLDSIALLLLAIGLIVLSVRLVMKFLFAQLRRGHGGSDAKRKAKKTD